MAHTVGLDDSPQVYHGDRPGSVRVAAPLPAPLDAAWHALTEPSSVEQWFGVLSGELVPGADVRLDLGDGDFFDLNVAVVDKPVLRWRWRFMGCGPLDAIELRLDARADGSVLNVTDSEPNRRPDEALALGEGWRDFTERLQRHLATGQRSRYDWRSDVEVWAELSVDADTARRIVMASAPDWLPLEHGARNLLTAHALVLDDGQEPATFAVEDVRGAGPASVAFALRPQGVGGVLPTQITVSAHGDAAVLAITQAGFRDLATNDAVQRQIRMRLAAAWAAAARRARELAERSASAGSGQAHLDSGVDASRRVP